MNPKKLKQLLPQIAIDNKEDLTLLTKLNLFYWGKVREALSTTTESKVNILNLGYFNRKYWNVDKRLVNANRMLKALEGSSRTKMIDGIMKDKIHLENILKVQAEVNKRKDLIKIKRDEYNKTLEES